MLFSMFKYRRKWVRKARSKGTQISRRGKPGKISVGGGGGGVKEVGEKNTVIERDWFNSGAVRHFLISQQIDHSFRGENKFPRFYPAIIMHTRNMFSDKLYGGEQFLIITQIHRLS